MELPVYPGYRLVADIDTCFSCSFDTYYDESAIESMRGAILAMTPTAIDRRARILAEMIVQTGIDAPRLLAAGCGAGGHRRAFELLGIDCDYHGYDTQEKAIELARELHGAPDRFFVRDATDPGFADKTFDICIFEGVLQYIHTYEEAIVQAARLADKAVIVHNVCVVHERPTCFFQRDVGADTDVPEIHFNERQLVGLLTRNGFLVSDVRTIEMRAVADGIVSFLKSYTLRHPSGDGTRKSRSGVWTVS